jgi:hypothetical protein
MAKKDVKAIATWLTYLCEIGNIFSIIGDNLVSKMPEMSDR